ncbi:MAG: BON domain-containing protein [Proteobacteria bacterium]|nr:BON domain-containing protein [Pseudomonadota bacterium]HQR04386.1 BON domain-containing protein [Rhodocyclaceae bacterium]
MTPSLRQPLAGWMMLAALIPLLSGCFGVAAVGMGAGALMVADRRPSDTYISDEFVEQRAGARIGEKYKDRVHVNVTSYNHMVLLTGEVPDEATRADMEKIVSAVPNVKTISNELQIAAPSSLSARTSDTILTSKVKGRFIDAGKFSANLVKVVTEAGTVYLMGLVTRKESDDAVEIARTTAGVMKVVRIMEIIPDAEARRIDGGPRNTRDAPHQ